MTDINVKDKYHAEILEKLESFYCKEPFFEGLLHETCENAKKCWEKKLNDNVKNESKWNYFSLPYIGKKYKNELAVVGLNVNKGGSRNLQEIQIRGINPFMEDKKPHDNDIYGYKYNPGVIESFKIESTKPKHKRKQKVFFKEGMDEAQKRRDSDKYGGTELWHRVAVYSKILLNEYDDNIENDFAKLAEIYERIIYMDAIKCSPATEKSEPTGKMGKLCPNYIFFKELEIIKPKNILIMSHLAAKLIRENKEYKYIDGSEDFPGTGRDYDRYKIEIGKESVNVYYIVHPTAYGGNRKVLFSEFAEFVKSKKKE